jgi:hypothetical protein
MNGYLSTLGGGVTSIENVIGGSGNDTLIGDDNDNILDGGAGDNTINGMGGNDTLFSGTGNNTLYGGDGIDTVYIAYGGQYSIPLNDIEYIFFGKPPVPPEPPVISGGSIEIVGGEVILIIPVVSQQIVNLSCSFCSGIFLRLPEGNQVYFDPAAGMTASLTVLDLFHLPAALANDLALVYGMDISLMNAGTPVNTTANPLIVSFVIPEWLKGSSLAILFWDKEKNAWVEVPSNRFSASQTGDKDRQIARVTRTGTYVLVVRGMKQSNNCANGQFGLNLAGGVRVTGKCGMRSEEHTSELQSR